MSNIDGLKEEQEEKRNQKNKPTQKEPIQQTQFSQLSPEDQAKYYQMQLQQQQMRMQYMYMQNLQQQQNQFGQMNPNQFNPNQQNPYTMNKNPNQNFQNQGNVNYQYGGQVQSFPQQNFGFQQNQQQAFQQNFNPTNFGGLNNANLVGQNFSGGINPNIQQNFGNNTNNSQTKSSDSNEFSLSSLSNGLTLTDLEKKYYVKCFASAKTGKDTLILKDAAGFLKKSKLDSFYLKRNWDAVIPLGTNSVSFDEFCILLRLTALQQQGIDPNLDLARNKPPAKLPIFEGVDLPQHDPFSDDFDDFKETPTSSSTQSTQQSFNMGFGGNNQNNQIKPGGNQSGNNQVKGVQKSPGNKLDPSLDDEFADYLAAKKKLQGASHDYLEFDEPVEAPTVTTTQQNTPSLITPIKQEPQPTLQNFNFDNFSLTQNDQPNNFHLTPPTQVQTSQLQSNPVTGGFNPTSQDSTNFLSMTPPSQNQPQQNVGLGTSPIIDPNTFNIPGFTGLTPQKNPLEDEFEEFHETQPSQPQNVQFNNFGFNQPVQNPTVTIPSKFDVLFELENPNGTQKKEPTPQKDEFEDFEEAPEVKQVTEIQQTIEIKQATPQKSIQLNTFSRLSPPKSQQQQQQAPIPQQTYPVQKSHEEDFEDFEEANPSAQQKPKQETPKQSGDDEFEDFEEPAVKVENKWDLLDDLQSPPRQEKHVEPENLGQQPENNLIQPQPVQQELQFDFSQANQVPLAQSTSQDLFSQTIAFQSNELFTQTPVTIQVIPNIVPQSQTIQINPQPTNTQAAADDEFDDFEEAQELTPEEKAKLEIARKLEALLTGEVLPDEEKPKTRTLPKPKKKIEEPAPQPQPVEIEKKNIYEVDLSEFGIDLSASKTQNEPPSEFESTFKPTLMEGNQDGLFGEASKVEKPGDLLSLYQSIKPIEQPVETQTGQPDLFASFKDPAQQQPDNNFGGASNNLFSWNAGTIATESQNKFDEDEFEDEVEAPTGDHILSIPKPDELLESDSPLGTVPLSRLHTKAENEITLVPTTGDLANLANDDNNIFAFSRTNTRNDGTTDPNILVPTNIASLIGNDDPLMFTRNNTQAGSSGDSPTVKLPTLANIISEDSSIPALSRANTKVDEVLSSIIETPKLSDIIGDPDKLIMSRRPTEIDGTQELPNDKVIPKEINPDLFKKKSNEDEFEDFAFDKEEKKDQDEFEDFNNETEAKQDAPKSQDDLTGGESSKNAKKTNFDVDWSEFGIETKQEVTPAPFDFGSQGNVFSFPTDFTPKPVETEEPKKITDLFSLYGAQPKQAEPEPVQSEQKVETDLFAAQIDLTKATSTNVPATFEWNFGGGAPAFETPKNANTQVQETGTQEKISREEDEFDDFEETPTAHVQKVQNLAVHIQSETQKNAQNDFRFDTEYDEGSPSKLNAETLFEKPAEKHDNIEEKNEEEDGDDEFDDFEEAEVVENPNPAPKSQNLDDKSGTLTPNPISDNQMDRSQNSQVHKPQENGAESDEFDDFEEVQPETEANKLQSLKSFTSTKKDLDEDYVEIIKDEDSLDEESIKKEQEIQNENISQVFPSDQTPIKIPHSNHTESQINQVAASLDNREQEKQFEDDEFEWGNSEGGSNKGSKQKPVEKSEEKQEHNKPNDDEFEWGNSEGGSEKGDVQNKAVQEEHKGQAKPNEDEFEWGNSEDGKSEKNAQEKPVQNNEEKKENQDEFEFEDEFVGDTEAKPKDESPETKETPVENQNEFIESEVEKVIEPVQLSSQDIAKEILNDLLKNNFGEPQQLSESSSPENIAKFVLEEIINKSIGAPNPEEISFQGISLIKQASEAPVLIDNKETAYNPENSIKQIVEDIIDTSVRNTQILEENTEDLKLEENSELNTIINTEAALEINKGFIEETVNNIITQVEEAINAEPVEEVVVPIDLTEDINNRAEELRVAFQANLYQSTLVREAILNEKFKLNQELIFDLAKELRSIGKEAEADRVVGQIAIIEEIAALDIQKKKLLENDELEEAIPIKNKIKENEKLLLNKEAVQSLLDLYDSVPKNDYRVSLLDELRKEELSVEYINEYYRRFLRKIENEEGLEDFAIQVDESKEDAIKYVVLAKLLHHLGEALDTNSKKILKRIAQLVERINKLTEMALNDPLEGVADRVIGSRAYQDFYRGVKMLQSLYTSLLQNLEFMGVEKEYTSKYIRRLENGYIKLSEEEKILSERNLLPEAGEIPVISSGNFSQLFQEGSIVEDYKSFLCHFSLGVSSVRLPEYENKHYFQPYLNFVLQECKN